MRRLSHAASSLAAEIGHRASSMHGSGDGLHGSCGSDSSLGWSRPRGPRRSASCKGLPPAGRPFYCLAATAQARAHTPAQRTQAVEPTRAPSDEDEPPAADTVSALKVILRRLDALSTDQTRTLLDAEAFNLLNRVGRA
jgi:hypothetical protein